MLFKINIQRTLLTAAVVVPALLFASAAWLNRVEAVREGRNSARQMASIMDEHARKVLDTAGLVLDRTEDRIRSLPAEEIEAAGTSEFLTSLVRSLDQAVSLWVSDAEGNVLAGSQPWDPSVSIGERKFFRAHVQEDAGVYISAPFVGKATGTPSFAISRRRNSPDGRFTGIVHLSLRPAYFAGFYRDIAPQQQAAAALVRSDGAVLARHPVGVIENAKELPDLPQEMSQSPIVGEYTGRSPVDGRERMFAYRRVGAYPAYVIFGLDIEAALSNWYRNLFFYGGVSGLAALALLGVSILALRHGRAEQAALAQLREQTEQRSLAERKLRQAQKMESIGQLTGGVAHDFNNLLAVVLGNLRLLGKRLTLDQASRRLLEGAVQGAERGAALTQRLLAFSRRQDLNPHPIDVHALIDGMSALLRQSLGPEVTIRTDCPATLPRAHADQNQLELALLNLALNARDAMPGGGVVTIKAREVQPQGSEGRTQICISVADTGAGMDEETRAKALDPFFTTKGIGKGTGLGLSMVHGFAAQSGGSFQLSSRLGEGTIASIWLPISAVEEHASPPQLPSEPTSDSPQRYRLLLVDDDPLVCLGTAAMLEDLGHSVIECTSGTEALKVLEHEPDVDLVITDQSMPGMTGLELTRFIRERWPAMPILIASGHAELPETEAKHLPLLNKPFSQEQVARAIEKAIALGPSREPVTSDG